MMLDLVAQATAHEPIPVTGDGRREHGEFGGGITEAER